MRGELGFEGGFDEFLKGFEEESVKLDRILEELISFREYKLNLAKTSGKYYTTYVRIDFRRIKLFDTCFFLFFSLKEY